MDEALTLEADFVHLARLAVAGRQEDVAVFLHRVARRLRRDYPELSSKLVTMLREAPTRASPLRRDNAGPVPVDLDTRLSLLRVEHPVSLDFEPIFGGVLGRQLHQVVLERERADELMKLGLEPSRSLLFVGPPGVGKTLAARWLASQVALPLLVLDLAAVMSSFLGRTGSNITHVMDYAKAQGGCVLLLDEFDAIAKRRQDDLDVGELKRLVPVLLQQIDDWPASAGLVVAATNHPDLLDAAAWRRFDLTLEFPRPDLQARELAIRLFAAQTMPSGLIEIAGLATDGMSFNDIERDLTRIRRTTALSGEDWNEAVLEVLQARIHMLSGSTRRKIAADLVASGSFSQRRARVITGVSRDTIRKDANSDRAEG